MPKPVSELTEDDILALPIGENDSFERKGARLLDLTLPEVNEGRVLDELAKQLSAFSNSGGGQIIYGIADTGAIDNGGIARVVKGSTKEWLEDVIPVLTDFEILGFNVHEIQPRTSGSSIASDRSVFVVEVPDSERAPHQSKRDLKYYVRVGGKSRPAPHRLIEDIRGRAKHPNIKLQLDLSDLRILGLEVPPTTINLDTSIKVSARNVGALKSQNTCFHLFIGLPSVTLHHYDNAVLRPVRDPNSLDQALFWEFVVPLYPEMDMTTIIRVLFPVSFSHSHPAVAAKFSLPRWLTTSQTDVAETVCRWTLYADNAPPKRAQVSLADLNFNQRMQKMIDALPKADQIHLMCGRLPE